jgi:hypothetical protein
MKKLSGSIMSLFDRKRFGRGLDPLGRKQVVDDSKFMIEQQSFVRLLFMSDSWRLASHG